MTTSAVSLPGQLAPARPAWPDATGHFGVFGGRFVPEALVAALDELAKAVHTRLGRVTTLVTRRELDPA